MIFNWPSEWMLGSYLLVKWVLPLNTSIFQHQTVFLNSSKWQLIRNSMHPLHFSTILYPIFKSLWRFQLWTFSEFHGVTCFILASPFAGISVSTVYSLTNQLSLIDLLSIFQNSANFSSAISLLQSLLLWIYTFLCFCYHFTDFKQVQK